MASERKTVAENLRRVLLREYLMKETRRAGFGGLDIQRTPMGTRVTLIAERPGLVIGRKGATIKALTDAVARDFNFDNPQIEVQEEPRPAINAQIMAEKLSNALERGWRFRRAGHSTLRRIREGGAKGALIIIAGKLTGRRHRTVKFTAGHVKYCGEPRNLWMDRGFAIARMKPGVIGVTVEIMDPDARLPDEVEIRPLTSVEAPGAEPVEAAAQAETEEASAVASEGSEAPLEGPPPPPEQPPVVTPSDAKVAANRTTAELETEKPAQTPNEPAEGKGDGPQRVGQKPKNEPEEDAS